MGQVVVEMSGDEARLYRSMQKIIDQQAKVDAKNKEIEASSKKTGKEMETVGDKSQKAFGAKAVAGMQDYLRNMTAVSNGIRLVGEALEYARQRGDAAALSLQNFYQKNQGLAQVATSGKDLQKLHDTANSLAMKYGVDRGEMKQATFDARSQGFEDVLPSIARYAPVAGAATLASVAGMFSDQGLFGKKGISPAAGMEMVYKSSQASKLDLEQYAPVVPLAGQGIMQAGGTPEEAVAALQALVPKYGRPSTAGDRIMHFGAKVAQAEDPRLKGKGLEAVRILRDEFSEEERKEFLKDSIELNDAYTNLAAEYENIRTIQKDLLAAEKTAGTPGSELEKSRAIKLDPKTEIGRMHIAEQKAMAAKAGREIMDEKKLSGNANLKQAAIDKEMARMTEEGEPGVFQFGGEKAGQAAKTLGASPEVTRLATRAGTTAAGSAIPVVGVFDVFIHRLGKVMDRAVKILRDPPEVGSPAWKRAQASRPPDHATHARRAAQPATE